MNGRRPSTRGLVVVGLIVSLALAFLVAPRASSAPDGLEKVAADRGFEHAATDHALDASPLADYATRGIGHDAASTGIAGAVGIAVTFAVMAAAAAVLHRTGRRGEPPGAAAPTEAGA